MSLRFGPIAFMIGFSCAYAAAYWFNLPFFLYYPLHAEFASGLHPLPAATHGPGMAWYGFLTDSAIASVLAGFLIPDRMLDRVFRNWLWVFPCAAMLTCIYLLRPFFLYG